MRGADCDHLPKGTPFFPTKGLILFSTSKAQSGHVLVRVLDGGSTSPSVTVGHNYDVEVPEFGKKLKLTKEDTDKLLTGNSVWTTADPEAFAKAVKPPTTMQDVKVFVPKSANKP